MNAACSLLLLFVEAEAVADAAKCSEAGKERLGTIGCMERTTVLGCVLSSIREGTFSYTLATNSVWMFLKGL